MKPASLLYLVTLLETLDNDPKFRKVSRTMEGRYLRKLLLKELRRVLEKDSIQIYYLLKVLHKILEIANFFLGNSSITCKQNPAISQGWDIVIIRGTSAEWKPFRVQQLNWHNFLI
jgi:hypothetical protein